MMGEQLDSMVRRVLSNLSDCDLWVVPSFSGVVFVNAQVILPSALRGMLNPMFSSV